MKLNYNLIGILLIFLSFFFFLYFISLEINECTSNPLTYSAKHYQDSTDAKEVFGILSLVSEDGNIQSILFNSTHLTLSNFKG